MNTASFLKYVWPFYNIMHEGVKLVFTEALLMDISKEFDAMNNELLITKLYAYGFSNEALGVLSS